MVTWAGNENLAQLTASDSWNLRVDLWDWAGVYAYAEYPDFKFGDTATNYTLASLGTYSGNASE